jgi:hypothetical protein
LFIKCEKGYYDDRYYVTTSIEILGIRPFEVKFLIDTGAEVTALNSSDIHVMRLFKDILSQIFITKGGPIGGISGPPIESHKLSLGIISFNSSVGKHSEHILDITITPLNFKYKKLGIQYGILGIDVLQRFDILFEGRYAYLRKNN